MTSWWCFSRRGVASHKRLFLALLSSGVVAALAGCGGSSGTPAADAGSGCTATFSGNFNDTVSGSSACPTLTSIGLDGGVPAGALLFTLSSSVAGAPTNIELDLGAGVSPGSYSSETVTSWSAIGINTANCEFSAGTHSVPPGSFSLSLSSVGAGDLHGMLSLTQYVKAPPTTSCGAGDTEEISVVF